MRRDLKREGRERKEKDLAHPLPRYLFANRTALEDASFAAAVGG